MQAEGMNIPNEAHSRAVFEAEKIGESGFMEITRS